MDPGEPRTRSWTILWPKSRAWRAAIVLTAAFVVVCVAAIACVIVVGRRDLARELAALRASGAPEFPKPIRFAAKTSGDDVTAWWEAIHATWVDWDVKDVEACRARLAAGEHDFEIEDDSVTALRDPRRVTALDACTLAILDRRFEADRASLDLALRVDAVAPFDWEQAWSRRGDDLHSLLVVPKVPGYLRSVEVLCFAGIRSALQGDGTLARARIDEALRAVEKLEPATLLTFLAWEATIKKWIENGFLPLLHLTPAGTDFSEVEAQLASFDVHARFRASLVGERANTDQIFASMKSRSGSGGQEALQGIPWQFAAPVWIDGDHATYLRLMRKALEATERPITDDAWTELDRETDLAFQGDIERLRTPLSQRLLPRLNEFAMEACAASARITLCRAALIARRDGSEAALTFLGEHPDPFDGQPLRSRREPDGFLAMWSVGGDRIDDPAAPGVPGDDIRVLVRPR